MSHNGRKNNVNVKPFSYQTQQSVRTVTPYLLLFYSDLFRYIYEFKYPKLTCFINDKRPNGSLTFEPLWYTLRYAGTSIYLLCILSLIFDLMLEFIIIFVENVVDVTVLPPKLRGHIEAKAKSGTRSGLFCEVLEIFT